MLEGLYRHDGWGIGLIRASAGALLVGGVPPIEWLELHDRDGFAADPFLIEEGGRRFCFFEALPYATNRGKICYAALDEQPGRPRIHDAIVAPFHLSYPYLLRHDGEILCIPEAGETGRVTAYAARDFPNGWYERHTLIDGFAGVDPTIFQHDGRWWMLATDGRTQWNAELHAWYADELFGTWRPHPGNPIKRGLAGSRPAGRPFVIDGRTYRPAQDCTLRYGRRLIINELLELSPGGFSERAVSIVEPDPNGPFADGLHTANACGDVIVVDGNHLHFEARQAARVLAARLRAFGAKRPLNNPTPQAI
jgi:hypothetical protein